MIDNAQFRFLPWTRRGLVAEVKTADSGGPLASRATVNVGITITDVGDSSVDLKLYGPGDVIGVDPRLIVRTDPRPFSPNVEPNYLPAIEFDPPDFPWMLTPAKAGGQERLRPWCVLAVLDRDFIERPRVEPGRPLPTVTIPAPVMARELPDLSESWAWAHTQVSTGASATAAIEEELAAKPDLNVSRVVCPRRLEPGKRYFACLVPAFDLGVQRGLGAEPTAEAPLGPAWDVNNPRDLELPVYYHWEFNTGPAGDFESLAQKLTPRPSPGSLGFARMYIGDADPGLPTLAAVDEQSYILMDGVLRAPDASSGELSEVPQTLRNGLGRVLDTPARQAEEGTAGDAQVLGPPLYGQWHADQHTVPSAQPRWLRELNLDPRARVAAGLGAEVVRANQEDFMQACWEQVGQLLPANELLNWARLAMDAARFIHQRHFKALPPDRLMQLTAPLHARALHGDLTVRARVRRTSLPDAALDPALRRLTSPQRPLLKRLARRSGQPLPPSGASTSLLLKTLAEGTSEVDPNRFVPDGVVGAAVLARVKLPSPGSAMVNLASVGLPIRVRASTLRAIRTEQRQLESVDVLTKPPMLEVRDNLRRTGLVTDAHIANLVTLDLAETRDGPGPLDLHHALETVIRTAADNPAASAFLITVHRRAAPSVDALDVDANNNIVVRTPLTRPARVIGAVDPNTRRRWATDLSDVLGGLSPGSLDRRRRRQPIIDVGMSGQPRLRNRAGRPILLPDRPSTNTLPPLVTEVTTVNRFESAFRDYAEAVKLGSLLPEPQLVSFDLSAARSTLLVRTDPLVMIPRRVRSMVTLRGLAIDAVTVPGIRVTPTFDRIMAAPDLPAAAYQYLAAYDEDRFLPGVDQILPDTITVLETNPRFIAAFMVGLNHEMNRELLWREYPTDQRGTPFRRFWDRTDGQRDIDAIHTWRGNLLLRSNLRQIGADGEVVLLIRGELLRRYPNTIIFAWRANGDSLKDPPADGDILQPIFAGQFGTDVSFVGFPLSPEQLLEGDGWFFVLQEQPTEPRFGFDEPEPGDLPALPAEWSDANWGDVEVLPGTHLVISGNRLQGIRRNGATFATNAAHLAAITLQKPMRVAFHARHLL